MDTRESGTDFHRFWIDVGTVFESFGELRLEIPICFRACFQAFLSSICESKFGRSEFPKTIVRSKHFLFIEIVFYEFGVGFVRFLKLRVNFC